ncbi:ABC transporter substrate-binding protein [Methylocapsa sp. S129]|uniref:ABC transporter substrate-binding protein n=1 Tax=Methylocapsa sp. S129 TaxID=1641869 RepID=UPI00131B33B5|nr:ABC transporter substrate-binding protein [Methylocapsa sp. S129]
MEHTPLGSTANRRAFLKAVGGSATLAAMGGFPMPAIAQTKQITIINDQSNANANAVFAKIATAFEAQSGVKVVINNMDHEANKTAIRNYLVAGAPDICFWFSGNRMKAFVKRNLFDDISDLIAREDLKGPLGGTIGSVTVDGKQYGLPMGGTLWGNFYLKDVFEANKLTVPTTWEETLDYGEKAKTAGLVPLAMGTKELWPAAGFFDEMNLRINGLKTHMALMDGQLSYLDPLLAPVFDHWDQLIKAGFFLPNGSSYGWQEAGALLGQKKAGMMNLGNFIKYAIPADAQPNLTFAPFPKIADIGRFEDFSVDSVHIPANAKNKELARDFLAFFYRPENLSTYLEPTGNISPRTDAPASADPLINQALQSLKTVEGTSQYYDRDTDPDMAQVGLNAFQEYMTHPERRADILKRLDETRKRIFKI